MREKLIEAVGSFKFPIESCGCTIGEYIVPYSIQEPLVDHLIASGVVVSKMETTTKWIPVTERLPEQTSRCLVARWDYVTDKPFIDILWSEKGVWWNRLHGGNYAVTHWMPLPEPPKGE
jgi:hypothetical protein